MGLPEREQHLDVCQGCGDMFVRESLQLCQTCATNEQRRFSLVREYLREHRGKSVGEIAAATGLPRGEVGKYIMQGRLIEIDPESGRRLDDGAPPPLTDMDNMIKQQAQRMFKAEGEAKVERSNSRPSDATASNGTQPAANPARDPGFKKAAGDADDDGRVRYVRRQRRNSE